MSATDFLDTNVLLYLLSGEHAKADRAAELLADGGVISVQVLNELASVATRKLGRPLSEAAEFLADLRQLLSDVVDLDVSVHDEGLAIAARYRFSIYDSMIVAAALRAGCRRLYTEDMQSGQTIGGLTIVNPFGPAV